MKTKHKFRFLYFFTKRKNTASNISLSLMIVLLSLTMSCSYYNVKQVPKTNESIAKNVKQVNDVQRYVIVHRNGHSWHLNNVIMNEEDKTVSGTIALLNQLHIESHIRNTRETHRYKPSKESPLNEVHFYLDDEVTLIEGENIIIPFSNISSISVNEKNKEKSTGMSILAGLGVTVGVLVAVTVIILATKSSCPFIYAKNGDDFVFIGELYPGVISSNIQRDDYIPLPHIRTNDNEYTIKITNELLEIQHTDLAQLIVVDHPKEIEVLLDKNGFLHTFSSLNSPKKVVLDDNNRLLQPAMKKDNINYTFSTEIEEHNSTRSIIFEFDKPLEAMNGKLYLTAKNSMWLDYVYGKFNEQFGSFYSKFQKDQETVSKDEKLKWITDQSIPLSIYLKTENGWELVDKINTVGPLAFRDLVVPIDLENISENKLNIKIETGFMFWEIDYIGMDYTKNLPLNITYIDPTVAIDENNLEVTSLLKETDQTYLVQSEVGNEAIITYRSDAIDTTINQSVFLKNRGFYTYIRDYKGMPDYDYLESFRETGAFTRFSEEVYHILTDIFDKDEIALGHE